MTPLAPALLAAAVASWSGGQAPAAVSAEPATCRQPADCGDCGVCVAGECRVGADRAAIIELHPVRVRQPVVEHGAPAHEPAAGAVVARLRSDLAWTGFYRVVDGAEADRAGQGGKQAVPDRGREGASGSEVSRVVRASLRRAGESEAYRLQVMAVDAEGSARVDLPEGDVIVWPGGERAAVAAWVNALVGHDTGLPGAVGTRVLASARLGPSVKEIVVMDCDGGAQSFVTANGALNLHPAWGPSGAVGYMSYARGNPDWVVDGVALSARPGVNAAGAWSPDGRLLALTVGRGGNLDIVLVDARSGDEVRRLTSHRGVDTSPSWSPDGRQLAFVSDRSGSPQIWRIDAQGGTAQRLSAGGYMTSPAWSPLGDVIVYAQQIAGGFALVRHDLASGRTRRISPPGASAEAPSFSPDGRLLIYVRTAPGGDDARLWTVRVDGSEPAPLPSAAWPLFSPDWQRRPEAQRCH